MKTKNIAKIIVDIIMTVVFISLLFAHNTGLVYHEIMGISVILIIILHLILNWNWIINISKNLFSGKIKSKIISMYILNIGLLLGIGVITITGLMISTIIFPVNSYSQGLVAIHRWSSYITAAMIAIHLLLHAKYLVTSFKKTFSSVNKLNSKKVFGSTFAIIMIAGVVYYSLISAAAKNVYQTSINSIGTATSQISETITSSPSTKKKESEHEITISSPEGQTEVITLSEFLSKMFCTLCPRHCALSNPQCGKSRNLIAEAKAEYQEIYGDTN